MDNATLIVILGSVATFVLSGVVAMLGYFLKKEAASNASAHKHHFDAIDELEKHVGKELARLEREVMLREIARLKEKRCESK